MGKTFRRSKDDIYHDGFPETRKKKVTTKKPKFRRIKDRKDEMLEKLEKDE